MRMKLPAKRSLFRTPDRFFIMVFSLPGVMQGLTVLFSVLWCSVTADAQVRMRTVYAGGMDPQSRDSHSVFMDPLVTGNRLLLVHLPASFDKTGRSSAFCTLAAQSGYRVISLAYPGISNMYSSCEHSTDANCYENFHLELFDGNNRAPQIEIDSGENILHRLVNLLQVLELKYPEEEWNQFLEGPDQIRYSSTIWSGHSDGAGHALAVAKYHQVHRVICFSGPKDFNLHYYLPPAWFHSGLWKTGKSEIFAFAHTADEYAFQREIWDSLGLGKYGPPVNVETNPPPYLSSHQLISSQSLPAGHIHGSTILDDQMPRKDGISLYEPVWKYLLDVRSTPVANLNTASSIAVYPNPVHRGNSIFLNADIKNPGLHLFDIQGRLLRIFRDGKMYIDQDLPAGPCFIQYNNGNRLRFIRLTIL